MVEYISVFRISGEFEKRSSEPASMLNDRPRTGVIVSLVEGVMVVVI